MKKILTTFFLIATVMFSLKAQDVREMLPEQDDIDGIAGRECEVYEGEALYDLINGGADLVFEYGFIETVSCTYVTDKESDVVAEVYQFEDSYSAYGYFTAMTFDNQKSEMMGTLATESDYTPVIWDGKYVTMIYTYDETPENKKIVQALAEELDAKIDAGSKPEIMIILNSIIPDVAAEAYAEGLIGFSNIAELKYNASAALIEFAMVYSTSQDMFGCFYYKYPDKETAYMGFEELENYLRDHSTTKVFEQTDYGFRAEDNSGMFAVCSRSDNYFVIAFGKDEELLKATVIEKIPGMIVGKTSSEE